MQPLLLLVGVVVTLLASPPSTSAVVFIDTGDCEESMEYEYKYEVEETYFNESSKDKTKVSCLVSVSCEAVGKYGENDAILYNLSVSDIQVSNSASDGDEETNTDVADVEEDDENEDTTFLMFHDITDTWFKFLQTDDGSIPAVFHSNSVAREAANFKKSITSAFQANFKGTSSKVEADTQSLHKSLYTYEASAQQKAEDTVIIHRTVESDDVEDYSTHIPGDVVNVTTKEDLTYTDGHLTYARGVSKVKMLPQKEDKNGDVEGDSLEAEIDARKKRDIDMSEFFNFLSKAQPQESDDEDHNTLPISDSNDDTGEDINYVYGDQDEDYLNENDEGKAMGDTQQDDDEQPSYDPNNDLPDFDAQGTYSLELVGQRQLLSRQRRGAVNHLELPEATQGTLLAQMNQTHDDMVYMSQIRAELKDISHALDEIHRDPNGTSSIVHKMIELTTLEGKYGALAGYTPAIDTVIFYLQNLLGTNERDSQMRGLLYLMLSRDGGCKSQKALVEALDGAINEDEKEAIVVYIAFTESPQPGMVSELEESIGDNVHSTESLLLAYGALVARASPALQQRMTLFLLNRLPAAEANTTSLIHHIFSLGNTESQLSTDSLVNYLSHPNEHVQLSAIHALRYATGDDLVQKALLTLVTQYNATDDYTSAILHCLLSGIEHASSTHSQPPFNLELAVSLVSSVMVSDNDELKQMLVTYLKLVDNEDSHHVLNLMAALLSKEGYSNSTRLKRGSNWAESNSVYELVASLGSRKKDLSSYPINKAYIWGKQFGFSKLNLQVAAGGFIGAAGNGNYKVFGRAKSVGHVFGKTKTALDFLVLREKGTSTTQTRLIAQIAGKTLANIDIKSASTVCKRYTRNLFETKKYLLLQFVYPIQILVAKLQVGVTAYVKLNSDLYVEFCEKIRSLTAEAGLENTITLEVQAGVTATLLGIFRGGATVSAVLNYKLTPALSTKVCLASSIRVKNCIGIYHQWANNKIFVDVWYQSKKCKRKRGIFRFCKKVWGSVKKVNALSKSWSLPSSSRKPLWERCDRDFVCAGTVSIPAFRTPATVRLRRPIFRGPASPSG